MSDISNGISYTGKIANSYHKQVTTHMYGSQSTQGT